MINICESFKLIGKVVDFDKNTFQLNEKVEVKIIEYIFLNYKIISVMKDSGIKFLLMKETIINIYKNKDKLFNDKNL